MPIRTRKSRRLRGCVFPVRYKRFTDEVLANNGEELVFNVADLKELAVLLNGLLSSAMSGEFDGMLKAAYGIKPEQEKPQP